LVQQQDIPGGISVHAGVAYFGAMGVGEGRVDIPAIGGEVNTAASLAYKAAAGEIIVSEATLAWTKLDSTEFETRRLDQKGLSQPVVVRVLRT
jgi:class 3 adenylate cyclase